MSLLRTSKQWLADGDGRIGLVQGKHREVLVPAVQKLWQQSSWRAMTRIPLQNGTCTYDLFYTVKSGSTWSFYSS